MPNFTIYVQETGEIKSSGFVPDLDWYNGQLEPGHGILPVSSRWQDQRIVDGEPVDLPPRPSSAHVFNYGTGRWEDPRTLADLQALLKGTVASLRYEFEVGGVTLDSGMKVDTSREARAALSQLIKDTADTGLETVWFKSGGVHTELYLDELREILKSVNLHVQACFRLEAEHFSRIDGLKSVKEAKSYDVGANWPWAIPITTPMAIN